MALTPLFRRRRLAAIFTVLIVAAAAAGGVYWLRLERPNNQLLAEAGASHVVLMDFQQPLSLEPLPPGWVHRKFLTRPAMIVSHAVKEGVSALRCETNASGSIFGRWTDIDLAQYSKLTWNWFVEVPIASTIDEGTRAGDDHPVRFFLQFADSEGTTHAAEIIWGNRLFKRGDWKFIDRFVHYTADGGDENTGRWRDESADLLAIYRKASGRSDAGRLTRFAIFCDSDDTKGRSVAYTGGQVILGR